MTAKTKTKTAIEFMVFFTPLWHVYAYVYSLAFDPDWFMLGWVKSLLHTVIGLCILLMSVYQLIYTIWLLSYRSIKARGR